MNSLQFPAPCVNLRDTRICSGERVVVRCQESGEIIASGVAVGHWRVDEVAIRVDGGSMVSVWQAAACEREGGAS